MEPQQQWVAGAGAAAANKTQRRRLNFITSTKNLAADTKQGVVWPWEGWMLLRGKHIVSLSCLRAKIHTSPHRNDDE